MLTILCTQKSVEIVGSAHDRVGSVTLQFRRQKDAEEAYQYLREQRDAEQPRWISLFDYHIGVAEAAWRGHEVAGGRA